MKVALYASAKIPVELPLSSGSLRVDTGRLPVAPPAAQRAAWPPHRTAA
ncbi:hypothetical protein LHJ74_15395 [Streptomyces sp. N2-109]|uniref:Uncharacterized protein n=1 Tax=Streptomyces gossypii TaxID=2883101 RepID=A0ABT2JUX8_9ACTN|nr:hypothetical protein [Streptomyces gossypii]MCT2591274.1 hypothetical protein [Streptomyces gossypii]